MPAAARQEGHLGWFRRKLREQEQAPAEAAAPLGQDPEQREDPPPPEPAGAEGGATKPRRRGTRGGAGRKKREPAKAATGEAAAPKKPDASPTRTRRRQPAPRRSPLPSVKKEMLLSHDVGEQRVAILEDGTPVEVYLERPGRRSIAGNVYKGVVDTVLPGMEASFVDIGLEKNGFLYVDEIVVPELEGRRHGRRIQDLISRGEQVLVQAVKDPMGTKGARLTTEISLAGRFLVYVPFGDGIGVSRRLDDDERERLKALCKGLELPDGGLIVRTAAEGATEQELTGDLAFLRKLWSTIQGRAARAHGPTLVYREAELPLRVVRDLFTSDYDRLAIDHERTYRRVTSYLKRTSPELARKVERYRAPEPLMARFGVDAAVRSTLQRRVDLPSGGYLVFDYAEAFTVIDVNTGRFVGARGRTSAARLEDTITKNNLEAAKEIVRQLRLRDIGGIIVIDFIDMANPKNRGEVEEALKRELERDRTKTYVVEISPLGLVEMTRQNVTDGPREILTSRCATCDGNGVVLSEETYAVEAERALRGLALRSSAEAMLVELASPVARLLIGPGGSRLAEIERETGKRFAFETRDDVPLDRVAVLAEGAADEIEPRALPAAAGDVVDLVLESTHLTEPKDAVARLDGYVVAVAGAAGQVGETVSVRIERTTRNVAYATLVNGSAEEAPVDPGALAEAADSAGADAPTPKRTRRGTRGGRGRKKATADPAPVAQPPDAGSPEAEEKPKPARRPRKPAASAKTSEIHPNEAEAMPAPKRVRQARKTVDAPVSSEGAEAVTAPEGAATPEADQEERPKKRTRRGSRGGRGRKKTSAPGAEPYGDQTDAVAAAAAPTEDEVMKPPEAETAAETPRKRTRRGTRGGRGRKRPTPDPAAPADEPEPLVASPATE
jgi:ribonuclease G